TSIAKATEVKKASEGKPEEDSSQTEQNAATVNRERKTYNRIDWPQAVREGQNNWIGRSEGIEIDFPVEGSKERITVFTKFPETIFGVTFLVVSPENPMVASLTTPENKEQVEAYIANAAKKSELERKENKQKTGAFSGSYVSNPVNGEKVPVWVADYVIGSYGTGAVMGVPGSDVRDFEFANEFGFQVIKVIAKAEGDTTPIENTDDVLEEGFIVNSGEFDGLSSPEPAREKFMDYLEEKGWGKRKVNYHLHDWSISRQRYWGTPIPIIYCDDCGTVPVPEKDLPVELPYDVDYAPRGKAPLATAEDWVKVQCPKCGKEARREVETMDTFVDSSWYFLRYLDPKNDKEIANKQVVSDWMPLDIYFGGAEHTLGHTLYSRFFYKFLVDIGAIVDPTSLPKGLRGINPTSLPKGLRGINPTSPNGLRGAGEYAQRRVHHGVILGPDGARMSKSKGNVVNPDEQVKVYGADAVRMYLAFLGPYDLVAPWVPSGLGGVYHFLERVWVLSEKVGEAQMSASDLEIMHKTIKKVGGDIEAIKFNTPVAALMEWLNYLSKKAHKTSSSVILGTSEARTPESKKSDSGQARMTSGVSREEYKTMLLLLAPFAPHMTEELWSHFAPSDGASRDKQSFSTNKQNWSIHQQAWPGYDDNLAQPKQVTIVVQINGKVRETLLVEAGTDQKTIEKLAMVSDKVTKFLGKGKPQKVIFVPGRLINFVG
ncbi:MAG: leucine--tRNA ligase, partial [Candidatus Curtissbacteria bacterium]